VEKRKGDKRGKSDVCGHTTRDTAKGVEKNSCTYLTIEDAEALWKEHS